MKSTDIRGKRSCNHPANQASSGRWTAAVANSYGRRRRPTRRSISASMRRVGRSRPDGGPLIPAKLGREQIRLSVLLWGQTVDGHRLRSSVEDLVRTPQQFMHGLQSGRAGAAAWRGLWPRPHGVPPCAGQQQQYQPGRCDQSGEQTDTDGPSNGVRISRVRSWPPPAALCSAATPIAALRHSTAPAAQFSGSCPLNSQPGGFPMTYMAGGRRYDAIPAGHEPDWQSRRTTADPEIPVPPRGSALLVFALPNPDSQ